ncbi:pilus assembly protein PilB [Marinobacter sp. CHS3-4]|uniref:pilus assembly protein PilB n=1 Tax=Marinobacter sp. CHS3-4 TaxID=3045174 RepID=UPI0024B5601C|nr:pilus assembly protein PilB [Marinobacter sp. CHS3-4]MDI9245269.1 pilus assembly protein PilB [Marinobacter sp. CHS3-4]
MKNRQGYEEKSRLGRLLVNRGYLSESQLDDGLRLQRETGQRLGEVFVQSGWITERELHRVLKHQSRYRHAAALVTMVVLPLQPMVSFASTSQSSEPAADEAGQMINEGKFTPMTDAEMAGVSGQQDSKLFSQFADVRAMPGAAIGEGGSDATDPDAIEALKFATNIFVPVLNYLDSELTISGVHYRQDVPRFSIQNDGGLQLAMPERIEQIRMENIRVGTSPSMGSITISDVRFSADTSMTIYAR